jgi:hypothetical protein
MQELIIGTVALLIAFLASLFNYKDLKSDGLQIFSFYLLATFVFQTGGYLYSDILKKSNHFIFNLLFLVENGSYLYIFHKILRKPVFKKAVIVAAVLFALYYCYEVLYINHFFTYSSNTGNLGNLIILLCCILFFVELMMADEILNFFVMPMFWICTGIMISVVGNFLYLSFFDYILKYNLDPDGKVYAVITTLICVIQYSFFTLGFTCKRIWTKPR